MNELQETLDTLEYKCWFYETALEKGSVDEVRNVPYDEIPEKLRGVKDNMERMHRK